MTGPSPQVPIFTTSALSTQKRWSDIAASHNSALPAVVPIQPVVDTYELCEQVLSYLPIKDLSRVRGVCHKIKGVVDSSLVLQQTLFLKPRQRKTLWVSLDGPDNARLLTGSKATKHIAASRSNGRATDEVEIFELHPLLFTEPHCRVMDFGMADFVYHYKYLELSGGSNVTRPCACPVDFISTRFDRELLGALHHLYLNKIFLSQPPVKEVTVDIGGSDFSCRFWFFDTVDTITVRNNDGVTFGQLLQEIGPATRRADNDCVRFEYMYFPGGLAMMTNVKNIVETAGELFRETDPSASIDEDFQFMPNFDRRKYRPWEWREP